MTASQTTTRAYKAVTKVVLSVAQAEGVGAIVRRSIGTHQLRNLDPFLMLDEFSVNPGAGFPDHPHRGFATVTYMLGGSFDHEDFCGHKGRINPGDLQLVVTDKFLLTTMSYINAPLSFLRSPRWMTAGRGILHAEMPNPASTETAHGLQLWVNLPAKDKMTKPTYQELPNTDVPRAQSPDGGAVVKVIAGDSYGVRAKVVTNSPILYLDVVLEKDKVFEQVIPENWTAFVYTLEGGEIEVGSDATRVGPHNTVVLGGEGDSLTVKAVNKAHFVVIGGQKINEPIVQHGPFVMNTRDEILQAFTDYERGVNGFEGSKKWASKIAARGGSVEF
ncbi:RmlC-like cupin domain-containing protein [Geranomyces variabilis]|nr:RmlC-like cupin domain-containing protein [Geranomyces variabilis]KAJ3141063.1 hypothetical protein HDU90_007086 [Geranomyces variabilis]